MYRALMYLYYTGVCETQLKSQKTINFLKGCNKLLNWLLIIIWPIHDTLHWLQSIVFYIYFWVWAIFNGWINAQWFQYVSYHTFYMIFWHLHMFGVFMISIFLTCVYSQRDFLATILHTSLSRGRKIVYM